MTNTTQHVDEGPRLVWVADDGDAGRGAATVIRGRIEDTERLLVEAADRLNDLCGAIDEADPQQIERRYWQAQALVAASLRQLRRLQPQLTEEAGAPAAQLPPAMHWFG